MNKIFPVKLVTHYQGNLFFKNDLAHKTLKWAYLGDSKSVKQVSLQTHAIK